MGFAYVSYTVTVRDTPTFGRVRIEVKSSLAGHLVGVV